MNWGVIAEAAGLFAVTNFDDIVVLSQFFAQVAGQRGSTRNVVAVQYLAFAANLALAVAVAFGASFLPGGALPYLGLLPIALGLRDAWKVWTRARTGSGPPTAATMTGSPGSRTATTPATSSTSTRTSSPRTQRDRPD